MIICHSRRSYHRGSCIVTDDDDGGIDNGNDIHSINARNNAYAELHVSILCHGLDSQAMSAVTV
jgi:hypothetical protein